MEMALRTSNLVLPEGFVEMDREEMMYVDGGLSTNALACMIDLGLIIVCGAINAGLRSAGFFLVKELQKIILKRMHLNGQKLYINLLKLLKQLLE